jgi:hypothetical protein
MMRFTLGNRQHVRFRGRYKVKTYRINFVTSYGVHNNKAYTRFNPVIIRARDIIHDRGQITSFVDNETGFKIIFPKRMGWRLFCIIMEENGYNVLD